jgi:hypothetical protein
VSLEVECIDRMYINLYIPRLQRPTGVAWYVLDHLDCRFASSAMLEPISRSFISRTESFCINEGVDLIRFNRGERKDDIAKRYLSRFDGKQGVLFVGKAQEKGYVIRTQKRKSARTGNPYPWLVKTTAMINYFYFYCVDEDFGPFFIKFCTYFPYNAKLCINGHEYAKRQLQKKGIGFEALDNGILSCDDPRRLQRICDGLTASKIEALVTKWFRILPHPFSARDRKAGYRYDISILQAEFSLTQVLERPVDGRVFFESVIRDNLDIGRPSNVQLIFNRQVNKRTPGRFRTRIITDGVVPSLHVDYKKTRIKQYHKLGRALRTETTINDTRDFAIGKRLHNLPALREIGFNANRRLLDVQRISHDCWIGEDVLRQMQHPIEVDGQRASSLRFADRRAQDLLDAILRFGFLPQGFSNRDLREQMAQLQGLDPGDFTQGMMTYDLRRLKLHGIIERIERTHRYRLTDRGTRIAMFYSRLYSNILRPGLSHATADRPDGSSLQRKFDALSRSIDKWCDSRRLAS